MCCHPGVFYAHVYFSGYCYRNKIFVFTPTTQVSHINKYIQPVQQFVHKNCENEGGFSLIPRLQLGQCELI